MKLTQYQIDAFAESVFQGNPAAIIPLDAWLPDQLMQDIAEENNLAETAYCVPKDTEGHYGLRWFTPKAEVELCGHATLAAAYVYFDILETPLDVLTFSTLSGDLHVQKTASSLIEMDFPALHAQAIGDDTLRSDVSHLLGVEPVALYRETDLLVHLDNEESVAALNPNSALGDLLDRDGFRGCIVTAQSQSSKRDFVSRFFAHNLGIPEDPVTGSAHCLLAPFWAERLDKESFVAEQISPRGGMVQCRLQGDRVNLAGHAVMFMEASIHLPNTK